MKEFGDSNLGIIKQKAEMLKWLVKKEMAKKVEELTKKVDEKKHRWKKQVKAMLIDGKIKEKLDVALLHFSIMKMAEDYKAGKICKEILNTLVKGALLSILKYGMEVKSDK